MSGCCCGIETPRGGDAVDVTLTTSGGYISIVVDGTGPTLQIMGFTGGDGIDVLTDGTQVFIENTDPGSAVTLTSAGGTETLVNDGVGPAIANKGLTAGTGMSLSSDAVSVTLTNSSPASSVTLTSAGGTETLVNDGTGPALANKGLTAGTGISLVSNATSVTIATTGAFLGYFSEKSDIVTTNGTAYVTVSTMDAQATATVGETWVFVCTALVCHPVGLTTVNTRLQWQYESGAGVWTNFETDINHNWPTSITAGERSTPSARTYQVVLTYAPQRIRLRMSMSAAVATGGQIEYAKVNGWRKT